LLVDKGEVLAAKLQWPGEVLAGKVSKARLISKPADTRRGTAMLENGREVLVDHLPKTITEGEEFPLRIVRGAIAERGRLKRPQGRYLRADESSGSTGAAFGETMAVFAQGETVRRFPNGLWEDVWSAASSGAIAFPGGELLICVTPAMTLIDIDCSRPEEAFYNAAPRIAQALRWFDMSGNIGIDFPSVTDKGDRKAVDKRLGECLSDWPHERTAMNGFGFVQLVAKLEGPSLLHRFATSRVGMCARHALRIAERADGAGVTLLTVHPALKAKLKPEWLDELRRRTGREVRIETDPGLALEAPHAQIVSS